MTKVVSFLEGGLGNFLFQIAAGYSFALKHKKDYFINLNLIQPGHTPIAEYKNNILRNIGYTREEESYLVYKEPKFQYKEINVYSTHSILLHGYFQSEKYFINYKNEILKLFQIDENTKDYLYAKYKTVLKHPTCSLHVRRGDYLKKQHAHVVQSLDYYKKCADRFNEDTHYLIFSDDIAWCEGSFNFLKNKTFVTDNKDYQDLYLMTLCNNNIIANSSFSWWGAWLNCTVNKTVLAPKNWFNSNYIANNDDVYCQNWVIL